MRGLISSVLVALAVGTASARAATTAEVLATDPAGEEVALGRNQNFYLRLGYATDEPTHLWVRPYFRGKEVAAGTNPSRRYTGSGEALGWFFLMNPGDQVDEVRVLAGDGSRGDTRPVAVLHVRIAGASAPATPARSPSWLVELRARDEAADREARARAAATPPSAGELSVFAGFMLAVLVFGGAGVAASAWGLWRWHGGWRIAAALPAALMGFVVVRIALDTARDPTSHNLWPFEVLYAGALSTAAMGALLVARRLAAR